MASRSASLAFILSLTDKVTAPLGKVKMGFSDLATQSQKHIKTMGLGLAGVTGAVMAINRAMMPALKVDRALGDVRSLGVTEDALGSLNSKALEFAVDYAQSADTFIASAYSIEGAIKGLTGNQLAVFTNASNVMAKATKTDAATMTQYVGTMYNLFRGQADAMGKGAWVERLASQTAMAVQLYRTSGSQIGDAFKAAGAMASNAGVDLAEQMAVLGTLGGTMTGGEAGNLYRSFFENVSGASAKLGMSFVDQRGQLLPMVQILDKLQGKFGDLSIEANGKKLRDAFGGKAALLIQTLMKDTDRLKAGMDQLSNVRGLEHAEQMAKGMVDPWERWAFLIETIRVAIGQNLIPALAPFMEWLISIGKTLLRWTQLFPNITRVIGITSLAVLTLIGGLSLLTFAVGAGKMAWLALVTIWKVARLLGLRTVAVFLLQVAAVALQVGWLALLTTAMGIIRGAMLLWQGAIWLVNIALTANPIGVIIMGIALLIALVGVAIYYWDDWTAALLNSEAFKWVLEKLQALTKWFNSMGGWSGIAKAAWAEIVGVFYRAINSLIEMINSIPGVNIEARLGPMPEIPGGATGAAFAAAETSSAAQRAQQTINAAIPSLSPSRPSSVPPGGLLTSIQNNTTSPGKQVHVESLTVQNSKPMSALELENIIGMAAGG